MEHIENDEQFKGLTVNRGIETPPTVNPYLQKKRRYSRPHYAVQEYVQAILAGNITMLSQAVTLIESHLIEDQIIAEQIIEACLPYSGNSVRVGITGVPGAGKSTSIDTLGMYALQQGKRLAVLAIDPSSQRSKGSILGDKTRMEQLSVQKNVFIRPSPSAGSLGGVARKTRETIILCEAAGFDTVFVETVGVGQSETAVHSMVDFFLLIQIPGAGDELQGIKRGIMEMADAIAINKADGDNIQRAELARAQYRNALQLFPISPSGWKPPVLTYSGYFGLGVDVLWNTIEEYVRFTTDSNYFHDRRSVQSLYWMNETIEGQLRSHFYENHGIVEQLDQKRKLVEQSQLSPFTAAHQILETYFKSIKLD